MGSDGWIRLRLGDVCEKIGSGATPRGGSKVYLEQGDVALIRSQNVHNNEFVHNGLVYIAPEHADQLSNVEVLSQDVLLNITGDSVARCCQVDATVLPARVNQHVAIIRPNPKMLDARFLRYILVSSSMQHLLLSWAGAGGTRNALTKGMIESLEILAPKDVAEQQAIAGILGALDDKIELNRRMNETLEAMARAIFQDWFVDFGPVRRKMAGLPTGLAPEVDALFPDTLVDSELGEIPARWNVGTLGDLAESPRRSIQPAEIEPDTPYIGLEHMPRQSISLDSWDSAEKVTSGKSRFFENEILFGKLRPYFHKVGVAPVAGICSTDIVVLRPQEEGWFGLVLGHASSIDFVNFTDANSTGTRMPRTSWGDMSRYQIALPPECLSRVYTDTIAPCVQQINLNIHENRTLSELRDTLLPKLVSRDLVVQVPSTVVLEEEST